MGCWMRYPALPAQISGWNMKKMICVAIGLIATVLLASCGGGGGGGGTASATPSAQAPQAGDVTLAFNMEALNVSVIEGSQGAASVSAKVINPSSVDFWIGAEETGNIIESGDPSFPSYDNFDLQLTFKKELPPGSYDSAILIHLCRDENCASELPNSPVRLPVHYVVKPNIHVQSALDLMRTGREAAPSQTVSVDNPSEAGQITAQLTTLTPDAMSATLSGNQLTIQTTQVKAGVYTGTVVLTGQANSQYKASLNVTYTVKPPVGGELGLTVDPSSTFTVIRQGQSASVRVKATRPTWTSQWIAPTLVKADGVFSVRDLGNDEYEVLINGLNVAIDNYQNTLRFSAGPTTGNVDVQLAASVNGQFGVGKLSPLVGVALTESSTEADLSFTMPVSVYDNAPTTWTAVAKVPWVTVTRSSGAAGIDDLTFKVDKTFALNQRQLMRADAIDVSINRPGLTPIAVSVGLWNQISRLQRVSSGTLMGSQGRIYVAGQFDPSIDASALLAAGYLHVTGAVVDKATILPGNRTLVLDVSGAQAGHPITARWQTNMESSQASTNVSMATGIPTGYLPLPYAAYRPAQYVPGLHALYWSGGGQIWRWSHDGATWQLTQASVDGAVDVAISPDESRLYVASNNLIKGFDPLSLAFINQGSYTHLDGLTTGVAFDAQTPVAMRAFTLLKDGQSFASLKVAGNPDEHGVAWIAGGDGSYGSSMAAWDLALAPHQIDPDRRTRAFPGTLAGSGIVTSPGGQMLYSVDPDGKMWAYYADRGGAWVDAGYLPAGKQLASVSNDGAILLRTDGVLQMWNNITPPSLSTLLPSTHVAGGYGLTPDGHYALIYSYRITSEPSGDRAREATVWIVDLQGITISTPNGARITGTISLPEALGCTGTLASGESCKHGAQVMIDPTGGSAFVLGPRGVAAVLLASAVTPTNAGTPSTAQKVGTRAQAQSISTPTKRISSTVQVIRH